MLKTTSQSGLDSGKYRLKSVFTLTDNYGESETITVESGSEHKMSDTPLVFTATNIPQTWTLKEGSLSNPVQYKITAFTTIRDRLDASGYIERYTS